MPPTFTEDLVFYQGATFDHEYTLSADGVAVDLSSYTTAKMQVRTTADAADALVTLTTAGGGIVIGGVAGTVEIIVTDELTAALSAGSAVYDLDLYHTNGSVYKIMRGAVTIVARVTQA